MFSERQFYGSRIAVFFNICQSLFYYCYKGIFNIIWNIFFNIIYKFILQKSKSAVRFLIVFSRLMELLCRLWTLSRILFIAVERHSSRLSIEGHKLSFFIYDFYRTRKHNCTREHMTYIVMNFPCNTVSFHKCCVIYLIILIGEQALIFFFEKKIYFSAVIPELS